VFMCVCVVSVPDVLNGDSRHAAIAVGNSVQTRTRDCQQRSATRDELMQQQQQQQRGVDNVKTSRDDILSLTNAPTEAANDRQVCLLYTVRHFVFTYNSIVSWSTFILFVPVETGMNILQFYYLMA